MASSRARGEHRRPPRAPRDKLGDRAPDPRAELQIALALGFFIVVSIVLRIAVRHRSSLGPDWLVPAVEIGS